MTDAYKSLRSTLSFGQGNAAGFQIVVLVLSLRTGVHENISIPTFDRKEVMVIVFFGYQGVLHFDFKEPGININADRYADSLKG